MSQLTCNQLDKELAMTWAPSLAVNPAANVAFRQEIDGH